MRQSYTLIGKTLRGVVNTYRGSITFLGLNADPKCMNWTASQDDQPYHPGSHDWGLGGYRLKGFREVFHRWDKAVSVRKEFKGTVSEYKPEPLTIKVRRYFGKYEELREEYSFKNCSSQIVTIKEASVFFPVNDAYPNPGEAQKRRAHAHIWCGGISSWINMLRMGGAEYHLGMVLTKGSVCGYRIENRSSLLTGAQSRGDIALLLNLPPLNPGETAEFSTAVFVHTGWDNFFIRAETLGLPLKISSTKYVLFSGESADIRIRTAPTETLDSVEICGRRSAFVNRNGEYVVSVTGGLPGSCRVTTRSASGYGWAELLVIPGVLELMKKRSRFIIRNQQILDPDDPLLGAYCVFDNETCSIIRGTEERCDLNAGRERIGMAVFLALLEERESDPERKTSLELYLDFFENKLLKEDGTVKNGCLVRPDLDRGYNYPWAAMVCIAFFRLTGNIRFIHLLLKIIRTFYRNFGFTFSGILLPVLESHDLAAAAGEKEIAQELLELYRKHADETVKRGDEYPVLEVNYEQSIVAPVTALLLEFYLITGEAVYLRQAERHLHRLELFAGQQPDYHLYDIGIRHWDAYWFGKSRMFGDTFPHHWSVLSAQVFHRYWEISGKKEYRSRCWNIMKANLCLFFPDGTASSAYIYPESVDGRKGGFYDSYGNDQDWILAVFLSLTNQEEKNGIDSILDL